MIKCKDDCGNSVVTEEDAEREAWAYLSITNSWRCAACARQLRAASTMVGCVRPGPEAYVVHPTSSELGGLKKATADTISAPVVARNPVA